MDIIATYSDPLAAPYIKSPLSLGSPSENCPVRHLCINFKHKKAIRRLYTHEYEHRTFILMPGAQGLQPSPPFTCKRDSETTINSHVLFIWTSVCGLVSRHPYIYPFVRPFPPEVLTKRIQIKYWEKRFQEHM